MHLRSLPAAAASQQAVAGEAEGIEFEYAASFARVIETRRKRAKTPRAGHEDENSSFTETTTTTQISTTQRVALARHNSLSRLAMHVRGQTPELVQEFDSPAKLDRLPSESKSVRREASWKGSFRGSESSGPNARIPSLVEERVVVKDEGRGLSVRQKLPTSSIDQAPRAGPRAAITPLSKDKHRRLPQNSHRLERTNTAPAILPNSTIEQLVKDLPTMDPAISMQDDKFCETMCFRCNTWFENAFLDGRIGACLPVMNCAEQLLQTALSAKSPNAEELALRTWTNLGSLYERTKDLKKVRTSTTHSFAFPGTSVFLLLELSVEQDWKTTVVRMLCDGSRVAAGAVLLQQGAGPGRGAIWSDSSVRSTEQNCNSIHTVRRT